MGRSPDAASRLLALFVLAAAAACGEASDRSGEVSGRSPEVPDPVVFSHYIAAEDGTRLAADVYLPGDEGGPYPALLTLTRYRRGLEDPDTGERINTTSPLDEHLLAHDYALVKVDLRGSGASFGTRPIEYGPQEVQDMHAVVEWVAGQPWADGNVGAFGTSYTGTTAELVAAVRHPALKAVIPGWSDFDTYASPVRPHGLAARSFIEPWSDIVGAMDANDIETMGASVRRVDGDDDGSLLAAAVAEHAANPVVFDFVAAAEYRDDKGPDGVGWAEASAVHWRDEIQASGVPMLVFASWFDAGTADGALQRFRHFANPQKVMILASTHGGGNHASPYLVGSEPLPPDPSAEEQFEMRRLFLDRHLKGADNGVDDWPPLRFYNLGEEAWHESDRWPPAGAAMRTWRMAGGGALAAAPDLPGDDASGGDSADDAPREDDLSDTLGANVSDKSLGEPGSDVYMVDRGVTTGPNNRWMAQMGAPVLNLDDRGEMDARMLTYTTEPLPRDVQIAGSPVIALRMASDRRDASLFVYLHDVDPEGRSRLVTDGGMRLIHRKVSPNSRFADDEGPHQSFNRADAEPMPVGEAVDVVFRLWPTSALFRAGHRIRVAIAGADADTFDVLPADGNVTFTVHRGGAEGSRIELPVVEGGLR